MRIKEEIRRLGYFWSTDEPDTKLPGTVSIFDGGIIELELVRTQGSVNLALRERWNRIVGQIEKENYVTLDNCELKKAENLGGISKIHYNVERAIVGNIFNDGETPCYQNLSFAVVGLDDWVGLNKITIDRLPLGEGAITLSNQQPEHIVINLQNGMQLSIMSTFTCPGRFSINEDYTLSQKADEFQIRPVTSFTLFSPDGCRFEEFNPVVKEIMAFLCFAANRLVYIDSMSAEIGNDPQEIAAETTRMNSVKIYYESWPYSKNVPEILRPKSIEFSALRGHGEKIIKKWMEIYEKIEPTLNLYLLVLTDAHPTSQGRLLALTQTLEGSHRRINGGSKSLGERIEHIIEPHAKIIGDEATQQELIRAIVNTRNFLTHNDSSLERKAAIGVELHYLCSKMERLFQLHILQLLGFNQPHSDLRQSLPFLFFKPESQKPSEASRLG